MHVNSKISKLSWTLRQTDFLQKEGEKLDHAMSFSIIKVKKMVKIK